MSDETNKPAEPEAAPAKTSATPAPEKVAAAPADKRATPPPAKPTIGPNMLLPESINASKGKEPAVEETSEG
jgi:hypothetical protein